MGGAPSKKAKEKEAREKSHLEKRANADRDAGKAAGEAATQEAMRSSGPIGRGRGSRACSVCHQSGHKAFKVVNGQKVVTCKTMLQQEARDKAAYPEGAQKE